MAGSEGVSMWDQAAAGRLGAAHAKRDALLGRWRHRMANGDRDAPSQGRGGAGTARFKRYTDEEVRRLNALQAAYFSKNVEIFEPPLPEGVPERLERIVEAGRIDPSDTVLDVGTGTGILLPLIQRYAPAKIYANDLAGAMLEFVQAHHPGVTPLAGDVADLALPDQSIGVTFVNACYPNIIDKHKAFTNLSRMCRPGGRIVISHPLGRAFVAFLKQNVPFPLDDFPADPSEAEALFAPYGLRVGLFVDEDELYILRLEAP